MGRDKAFLPFRGGTLAGFVAREVLAAASSAVLVGDPKPHETLGFPVVPDLYPGEGPLGGILTALAHSPAEWNLIVACDMPAVSADFLRGLLEAAENSQADALVPSNPVSGLPEPLCAVYRAGARPVIQAAFARGVRTVMTALASDPEHLRLIHLHVPDAICFQNVNTPEEWASVDL